MRFAQAEQRAQHLKTGERAKRSWDETEPIAGTLAESYLRDRGITIDLPDCLRFHPNCWHPTAKRFPAMVTRIDGGEYFSIHRTYLCPDGTGKAVVDPPKAMLGRMRGGAVRLTQSTGPLVVCEGIETGLSLAQMLSARQPQVWAAMSTSGITAIELPPFAGRLTIAPDGDEPGQKAAAVLKRKARKLGWAVSILPAPDGEDFNDVLMKGRG